MREDAAVEIAALKACSSPSPRALCIGSAGCTAFSLLAACPRLSGMTVLDINPAQTRLIRLKARLIERMRLNDLRSAITIDARPAYTTVQNALTDEDRRFWNPHTYLLAAGLNHCGSVDRSFRSALRLLYASAVSRRCLQNTLSAATVAEQAALFDQCWNNERWRLALRIALNRIVLRAAYGPHFTWQVPSDFSQQVASEIAALLRTKPARDNGYVWQAFLAVYPPNSEESLPPYLQKQYWSELQASLSRAKFATADVVDHLRACPPASLDFFALSNVLDAASDAYAAALLQSAAKAAAPGAILCLRSFFRAAKTLVSSAAEVGWEQDMALKTQLEMRNRSPFCPNVLVFRRAG